MSRDPSRPVFGPSSRLSRNFFSRDVLEVAPECLGLELVAHGAKGYARGRIVEVEAYRGPDDRAAHSFGGKRTARTEAMFGEAGFAYVFLIYGIHNHINIVTGEVGQPQAVLIRALEPLDGVSLMQDRRRHGKQPVHLPERQLCSGPGKLCSALGIDRRFNQTDLLDYRPRPDGVWLTAGSPPPQIAVSTRVGVDYAGDWAQRPWRFFDAASPCVSRPARRTH